MDSVTARPDAEGGSPAPARSRGRRAFADWPGRATPGAQPAVRRVQAARTCIADRWVGAARRARSERRCGSAQPGPLGRRGAGTRSRSRGSARLGEGPSVALLKVGGGYCSSTRTRRSSGKSAFGDCWLQASRSLSALTSLRAACWSSSSSSRARGLAGCNRR